MRTWTQLLDDYETRVAAVEAALERADASGAGGAPTPVWEPPQVLPAAAPTRAERVRHEQLQSRADACRDGIQKVLAAAAVDLDAVRRIGVAARAYGSLGERRGGDGWPAPPPRTE